MTRLCKNPFSSLFTKRKNMIKLNRQLQSTIVKFYINQILKDLGIEAEASKKKIGTDYK